MANLQATVRRNLLPILLLFLVGGYLVVLAELFLYQHWEGAQLIGFSATVIGLLAVLLGLFAKGGLRIGLAVLLAILSISGVIGVYEHFEHRAEFGAAPPPALTQAGEGSEADESDEVGEHEAGHETPPPLAPLSIAGLSLMGAVVLLAKQDKMTVGA